MLFGATRATVPLHPIRRLPADACTEQLGVPGPWHERLPHFRMDHTPSSGAELQSEYLVAAPSRGRRPARPRRRPRPVRAARPGLRGPHDRRRRTVAEHRVSTGRRWRSTSPGSPTGQAVRRVLPTIEAALAPFEPRPHWGKLFTLPREAVRSAYERLPRFVELVDRYDPERRFRNAFLGRWLGA